MKTLIKVMAVILLISICGNVWQWINPREVNSPGKVVYLPGKNSPAVVVDNKTGGQAISVKNSPEYKKATAQAQEAVKAVEAIIDLGDKKKIAELTVTKANLELELNSSKMTLNDVTNQLKTWETKYNKVMIDNANNTARVFAEVDPVITSVEKREAFYKPKETYTIVTSKNEAVKFNGLESYTFKNPRPKDVFELNLKTQALYLNETILPNAAAELVFNPDGRFKYFGGAGYIYNVTTNSFIPYGMAGVQFNIIRF